MAPLYRVISVLFFVATSQQLSASTMVLVEGDSSNIPCDRNLNQHPIYWDIQGYIYDLHSLPEVFTTRERVTITIAVVERRMNGWRLQCFSIDHTNPERLNSGQITELNIYNVSEVGTPGPPVLRRLVLDYQELQVGPDTTTVGWFYSPRPNPPCVVSHYKVAVYTTSQIDNEEFAALRPSATFNTTEQNITIGSRFLKDGANNENYLQVSAVQENGSICATSAYLNRLLYNESNTTRMDVNGTSATFELPEALREDSSLQLIWSKDDGTQCVCPPVEHFMSRCACNLHNPDSNVVTIANYTITISNLTQEMGEGEVTLHLVSSVSSGCRGTCNLRSIVHRITITQLQGVATQTTVTTPTTDDPTLTTPTTDNPTVTNQVVLISSVVGGSALATIFFLLTLTVTVLCIVRSRHHKCGSSTINTVA